MELDLNELEKQEGQGPHVSKFQAFLESQYTKQIENLAMEWPQKKSLLVDFHSLEHYDFELADELLESPDVLLEASQMAVQNIRVPTLETQEFKPYVRFFNLPKDRTPLLRNVGAEHLGKLISVEGIVRQLTDVLPKLKIAAWQCRRCGNVYKREQESDKINTPAMCECKHRDFQLLPDQSVFIDNQKIQIQEPLELLKGSEQATILDIIVSDDLVNKVLPGDRTRITGVVRLKTPKEKNLVFGRFVEAVHLEETAKEFDEVEISREEKKEIESLAKDPHIYEKLAKSIAPNIYGHEMVKEAIALQLFGGVKKLLPNETNIRGNIHVLLVGDPGTAKSQMLQAVNKIAPKSIYTAGKTSTGVGLCVAPDSVLSTGQGTQTIRELVEKNFDEKKAVEEIPDAHSCEYVGKTKTLASDLSIQNGTIEKAWKIKAPKYMIRVQTDSGKELCLTPATSLVGWTQNEIKWMPAEDLQKGNVIAVANQSLNENDARTRNGQALATKNEGIQWEIITSKKYFAPPYEFVYDFTVKEHHNFIANGFFVHNTASAVKDDFGEGGWTLKAGALVLANGGLAMIDEFDKMEPEDRSAMHEAMEQGMISVAKAGIVTRFKTDTTILAAANPKFARFDQYKNFLEQIDLPPTLISRFDLFFMIFDVLDRKKDEEIAQHILKTHQAGETMLQNRLKGGKKRQEIEEIEKSLAPEIPAETLKKFISYARQSVFPVLTKEAIQIISEYYVNLRELGKKQGTYTATHRQLEGLVRLAEASARIRLSDTVEKEDTDRAIRLLRTSLQELVTDKETGHLDIDLLTTGQSTSQTNQIKSILGIVQSLNAEHDKVLMDQVLEEAQKQGIDREKAREFIGKLKRSGDLYEPSHGIIKPVHKEF